MKIIFHLLPKKNKEIVQIDESGRFSKHMNSSIMQYRGVHVCVHLSEERKNTFGHRLAKLVKRPSNQSC